MALMELSLDTTNEAVDWVCTLLADTIDINDVQITEYTQHEVTPTNWQCTIRLYLAYDIQVRSRVEKIVNLLSPLHRTGLTTEIETTIVEEKSTNADLQNPFVHRIGKRFVILTPDAVYQSKSADEITLRLQKSLAFGTGLHPATIICLRLLEKHIIPSMNVLDLGSGSGILSVAMAKLGANVLALDNDSIAVEATQDAVQLNGVEQQVKVMEGSLGSGSELGHWMGRNEIKDVPKIEATGSFDLIVANILSRVHIALADDFRRTLRYTDTHAGLLIVAGFTTDHEEDVKVALTAAGLEFVDSERLDDLVALAWRLPKQHIPNS
ncbi:50S ribosomal protein L11 methyltransferase [Anabaena sp. 4-3]|uniref:50S ribosomal protein L11 methyltransferase n=1 Tax=Anabaena sp. 4-3 TaxID=1811979 RepID=UPI0008341B05|nr:50S ribosomal protein L11 methyltransferase [Anabaena sp. 4-3]